MSKMYKREGRRFVAIQDVTGMYLQEDGTFQSEKNNESIGICVLQTMSIRKVALLFPFIGTWDKCATYCKKEWVEVHTRDSRILKYPTHMPTRQEMYLVQPFIENKKLPERIYWTSEESCCSSNHVWVVYFTLDYYFGGCNRGYKGNDGTVLAFVDIPI